jgi:hypothetical protein
LLPLDICAEDSKRADEGAEDIDDSSSEEKAAAILRYVAAAHWYYTPISFWTYQQYYVELGTEKSDLKSLFARVTDELHVITQNLGGWPDLNVRAGMMRRFQEWEAKGKKCVLLYCGDHDPGGLQISDHLRANFEELESAVGWSPRNLIIERFGLDYDFIAAQGLTWIDNLETSSGRSLADPHHPDFRKGYVQSYLKRFGARKVEANALVARPEAGRALCREAIMRFVREERIGEYEAELAVRREGLRQEIARQLRGEP